MAASGELAVSAMQTDPAARGSLRIAETDLKTLASMFASPIETTDPSALTRASGELSFSYADGALKLDPLKVRLDDSNLSGYLNLLDTQGPTVRTKLTLDQIEHETIRPEYEEARIHFAVNCAAASCPPQARSSSAAGPLRVLPSLTATTRQPVLMVSKVPCLTLNSMVLPKTNQVD